MIPTGIISHGGAVDITSDYAKGYEDAYGPTYKEAFTKYVSLTMAVYKTSGVKPILDEGVSGASGPSGQEGGYLSLAKRAYHRGKTLSQHEPLLKKIKDKTIVV